MSYLDVGYNENLIKEELAPIQEIDPLEFDQFTPDVSGSKIFGGVMKSKDGRLLFDLENNTFIVSDGVVERIRLGVLDDDTIGLVIKDKDDNELMRLSGEINLIQSPTGRLQLDFDEERILVKDETETPRALIGKGTF